MFAAAAADLFLHRCWFLSPFTHTRTHSEVLQRMEKVNEICIIFNFFEYQMAPKMPHIACQELGWVSDGIRQNRNRFYSCSHFFVLFVLFFFVERVEQKKIEERRPKKLIGGKKSLWLHIKFSAGTVVFAIHRIGTFGTWLGVRWLGLFVCHSFNWKCVYGWTFGSLIYTFMTRSVKHLAHKYTVKWVCMSSFHLTALSTASTPSVPPSACDVCSCNFEKRVQNKLEWD